MPLPGRLAGPSLDQGPLRRGAMRSSASSKGGGGGDRGYPHNTQVVVVGEVPLLSSWGRNGSSRSLSLCSLSHSHTLSLSLSLSLSLAHIHPPPSSSRRARARGSAEDADRPAATIIHTHSLTHHPRKRPDGRGPPLPRGTWSLRPFDPHLTTSKRTSLYLILTLPLQAFPENKAPPR